jgi:hypothetical protein
MVKGVCSASELGEERQSGLGGRCVYSCKFSGVIIYRLTALLLYTAGYINIPDIKVGFSQHIRRGQIACVLFDINFPPQCTITVPFT